MGLEACWCCKQIKFLKRFSVKNLFKLLVNNLFILFLITLMPFLYKIMITITTVLIYILNYLYTNLKIVSFFRYAPITEYDKVTNKNAQIDSDVTRVLVT